jgi:hypothetical protein
MQPMMPRRSRKPLQIDLDADQERVLRALAGRDQISLAELIRRRIDRYLVDLLPPEADPSLGLIGVGHSGRPDLSTSHDELIAGQPAHVRDSEDR